MRILLIAVLVGALFGCETGSSGRWVQDGRTDEQALDDHTHCRKVAMQESDGQRSVDPFKEAVIEENCMKRMGYTYVKNQPNPSSSRY
jgi:hypothetical protein